MAIVGALIRISYVKRIRCWDWLQLFSLLLLTDVYWCVVWSCRNGCCLDVSCPLGFVLSLPGTILLRSTHLNVLRARGTLWQTTKWLPAYCVWFTAWMVFPLANDSLVHLCRIAACYVWHICVSPIYPSCGARYACTVGNITGIAGQIPQSWFVQWLYF